MPVQTSSTRRLHLFCLSGCLHQRSAAQGACRLCYRPPQESSELIKLMPVKHAFRIVRAMAMRCFCPLRHLQPALAHHRIVPVRHLQDLAAAQTNLHRLTDNCTGLAVTQPYPV